MSSSKYQIYNNEIVDLQTKVFKESLISSYSKIKELINDFEKDNKLKITNEYYEDLLLDKCIVENSIRKLKYMIKFGLLIFDENDEDDMIERINNEWIEYEVNNK